MPASYRLRDWNDAERSFWVTASTANPIKCTDIVDGKEVEYWEALEGWDFTRFEKNPLIFETHATDSSDAVIGTGSHFKETADGGLELKVTLASVASNPRTEVLARRIKDGLLRGVSVGWDHGERTDEKRGGKEVRVYRKNKLNEVSLVPLPKDENGLIEAEPKSPEEKRREKASNAARELARSRYNRTDAADDDVHRFDFVGNLGKFSRTPTGGLKVPARLTRTGVLEYRKPDGTIRRELRLPEEVFNADSLASLEDATVTNLDNHRGLIGPENWKDATLGHARNIRHDGKFVEADLHINDAQAIIDLENGRLHDISCGYSCKLDMTPGLHEGQPYDAIQRRIRYNHVAVLPKGRGRAGTDVALRLDAKDAVCVEAETTDGEESMTVKVIRLDGRDFNYGSEEHINHLEMSHKTALGTIQAELSKFKTEHAELTTRCDKAEGSVRAFEKKAEEEKKNEEEAKRAKEAEGVRAFRKRVKLVRNTIRMLELDEDDEEKMDALDLKSDRDLMLDVIRADARWKDEKFDGKSDEYVGAIYDSVAKAFVRTDGIDHVVDTIERVKRVDAASGDKDPAAKSRAEMNKAAREAWQKPLS